MSRDWYRPSPPPSEPFRWSARDNVNYMETAALAALHFSAQQSKSMLENFYHDGFDSWRKGVEQAPFAFLIPTIQGDPTRSRRSCRASWPRASRCIARPRRSRSRKAPSPREPMWCGSISPMESCGLLVGSEILPEGCRRALHDISWELPPTSISRRSRPPTAASATPRSRPSRSRLIRRDAAEDRGRSSCSGHGPGGLARGALPARRFKLGDRRAAVHRGRQSTIRAASWISARAAGARRPRSRNRRRAWASIREPCIGPERRDHRRRLSRARTLGAMGGHDSIGWGTRSINATFLIRTCATGTCAKET